LLNESSVRNCVYFGDVETENNYSSLFIFRYSIDFGKSELEVIKHVSNYLDPTDSAILLDLLASSELKVTYQPYDWGLNY
jgi:hypothetical protein